MSELKIFIGFDPRQPVAFQVCAQSIWEHASKPVSITRLDLRTLPIQRRGLTEFTYSRFLVPHLSNFEGTSVFLDSDILVRGDICELLCLPWLQTIPFSSEGVAVVKGPRKFEWASVMCFSNAIFPHLTPEFIEDSANRMYDWKWCGNEPNDLPKEWNHLVGYDAPNPDAKIVHYTMGLPVWQETKNCEFAAEWWDTFKRMNSSVSFNELMGRSVHVPHLEKLKVSQ